MPWFSSESRDLSPWPHRSLNLCIVAARRTIRGRDCRAHFARDGHSTSIRLRPQPPTTPHRTAVLRYETRHGSMFRCTSERLATKAVAVPRQCYAVPTLGPHCTSQREECLYASTPILARSARFRCRWRCSSYKLTVQMLSSVTFGALPLRSEFALYARKTTSTRGIAAAMVTFLLHCAQSLVSIVYTYAQENASNDSNPPPLPRILIAPSSAAQSLTTTPITDTVCLHTDSRPASLTLRSWP